MLLANKTPNEYTMARQTIPFLVTSDLFDTNLVDPIAQSFKYLFELKTLRDDGTYRTFSTVAIPPRPDNLTGLFDASKLIQSAIDFDNSTQKIKITSPMPRSIVQFRVFCSERYLNTTTNEFITGDRIDMGIYYAIDGGTIEGLSPYIIETTGATKNAMHHHELLKDQFVIRPGEPLTASFFTKASIGASILDFIHGDYGSFDFGSVEDYTGISSGTPGIVLQKSITEVISGAALRARVGFSTFNVATVSANIIEIRTLNLQPNKKYEFSIFIKTSGLTLNTPTNVATYTSSVTGNGIDTIISQQDVVIRQSIPRYRELKVVFDTNNNVDNDEIIIIQAVSLTANNLIRLNNRSILFDTAVLKEIDTYVNPIDRARIVVDKGLPTEIQHVFEATYLSNVIGFNEIAKARFDCPIGLNQQYDFSTTGATQNAQNQFLNSAGQVGKKYRLELFNSDLSDEVLATTEDIYQIGDCQKYNTVRLKWLNDLGAWDYYTFDKVSVASTEIEKDVYKITGGRIVEDDSIGGFDYIERDTDRGYKGLQILADDYIIINSDWVKHETGKYLRGILTSKEVYILNPEPYMELPVTNPYELEYPVIIEDQEFEFRNNSSEAKLANATFRIKIAVPFNDKTTNI